MVRLASTKGGMKQVVTSLLMVPVSGGLRCSHRQHTPVMYVGT